MTNLRPFFNIIRDVRRASFGNAILRYYAFDCTVMLSITSTPTRAFPGYAKFLLLFELTFLL